MDGSESERVRETDESPDAEQSQFQADAQSPGERASDDLRTQIAALRRQVHEAQEALREHQQQRQDPRANQR
jgi:N-methylhydantoinase B/oxoprolinase/acetone carboxylase alpha subunit